MTAARTRDSTKKDKSTGWERIREMMGQNMLGIGIRTKFLFMYSQLIEITNREYIPGRKYEGQ